MRWKRKICVCVTNLNVERGFNGCREGGANANAFIRGKVCRESAKKI
jgi:hypothetical protein